MKKIIFYSYIIILVVEFVVGILINCSLKELKVFHYTFKIELWMLSLLVLIATNLSLWAVIMLREYKSDICREAQNVEINEEALKKIDKRFRLLSKKILVSFIVFLGAASGYAVVQVASLQWKKWSKIYAIVLVSALIAVTLYGYVYFMIIVVCMRTVYYADFGKYTFAYPIATSIFEKYTRICSFGLLVFWMIGLILVLLSVIVFNTEAFFILAIIGVLIFVGYVIFTFYPYYITRKKISMLKMQTIRTLCEKSNMLERKEFDIYADIIKYISDSPDIMSTNSQLILISTLAAIAGLITPILSLF